MYLYGFQVFDTCVCHGSSGAGNASECIPYPHFKLPSIPFVSPWATENPISIPRPNVYLRSVYLYLPQDNIKSC